jgi:UDP-N-acetylglucosamine--N-acetylmuramyl-(pentapeptide) pyrophosphoryl-undecaprenol N-acetylglucosamine transferase
MKTLLLVGGGTLGSVNPLLATAAELKHLQNPVRIVFWGERNARDRSVVEAAGVPFVSIPAGKFRRYFSLRNIVDVPIILWATVVAWRKLRVLQPAMVITAGSYVAVPVVWAARRLRIPVLLYQQDATLGLANRLIAKHANIRCAVADAQAHLLPQPVAVVGYALRPDLRAGVAARAAAKYGLDTQKPTILVIGGSSGALALNRRFIAALPHLQQGIQVIHITGEGKSTPVVRNGYVPVSFTNQELPDLYALATFVVSRAGSNVLAELIALGKPALIVPLPNTHQVQNAAVLEERGALVSAEGDLSPQHFAHLLNETVTNPERLVALRSATADTWDTDGAAQLAALITKNL